MNRLEYVHELHDAENIREIITSAVSAFCDQKTDAILMINLGFENMIAMEPFSDTTPKIEMSILKAEDHFTINKPSTEWTEDMAANSKPVNSCPSSPISSKQNRSMEIINARSRTPDRSREEEDKPKVVVKGRAKLWELPSGEVYAVRYEDLNKRKLNFRKSSSDVETAQEVPAVREKIEKDTSVNDRTDGDCTSIKTDLANSRESVFDEKEKTERLPAPIIVAPPVRKHRISLRRRPYRGEFMITNENNGVVTFFCSTKHMTKKQNSQSTQSP